MRIQCEDFQLLYIFVQINAIKNVWNNKKNFETRSGSDNRNEDACSEHSDEEYRQRKAEIEKKYDISKGPYRRIKIITQQLVEEKSDKSESEWGK